MLQRVPSSQNSARNRASANGSESTAASDNDDSDWFGSIGRTLLGKDAGFALHLLTGTPEGSCYKYVTTQPASRRQPPGWLIVQLLRTDQGRTWLNAFMDGSEAEWWCDFQRAQRIAEAIRAVD
jgi:hypothetical protein